MKAQHDRPRNALTSKKFKVGTDILSDIIDHIRPECAAEEFVQNHFPGKGVMEVLVDGVPYMVEAREIVTYTARRSECT